MNVFKEQYGRPFEPESSKLVQFLLEETVGYMRPSHTPVHEAAVAVNGLRDRLLAHGLKDLWDNGVSTFIPFGYTHGLTLKNFIETLGINGVRVAQTFWRGRNIKAS